MANVVKLEIRGDDKATAVLRQFLGSFDKTTAGVSKGGTMASRSWDLFTSTLQKGESRIKNTIRHLTSLQGLLLGWVGARGLGGIASSAIDVASSFEQMEVKLNALTKGRGKETLDALNDWALEMPVNTRKAVDTFAMMKSYGLDPTIESMQTLVDVSVLFGEDAMPRVARALGQMRTLGKLSAEELNQLSEAGINARKYITEAFGKTVEELQKTNTPIQEIIQVIWKGLAQDFGGAAKEAQRNWQGLKVTTVSYLEEIERRIMEAGLFDELKNQLIKINEQLKNWLDNNDELIKQKVPEYIDKVKKKVEDLFNFYNSLPAGIVTGVGVGLVGSMLFGPHGWLLGALPIAIKQIDELSRKLSGEGLKKNYEEFQKLAQGQPYVPKVTLPMPFRPKEEKPGEKPAIGGGVPTPAPIPFEATPEYKKLVETSQKEEAKRLTEALDEQQKFIEQGQEMAEKAYQDKVDLALKYNTDIASVRWAQYYDAIEMAQQQSKDEIDITNRTETMKIQAKQRFFMFSEAAYNAYVAISGKQNKLLFAGLKAAQVAQATTSAFTAYAEALAIPPGPTPAHIALAKWSLASGLFAAGTIAATAIGQMAGGGMGAGGPIGTYAASPVTGLAELPTEEAGAKIEVHVHGPVLGETKEALGDFIVDLINDASEVRGRKVKATEVIYQ